MDVIQGGKPLKLPPFLKKLVELTDSCSPEIGAWSEDGSQFVVKSSKFADLVLEHFDSTLQTFLRQLHFYSFTKHEGLAGNWTFSHPSFRRGQSQLLSCIQRRGNLKNSGSKLQEEEEEDPTRVIQRELQKSESRLLEKLEPYLKRIEALVQEVATSKQQIESLERIGGAENVLLLAPEAAKTRAIAEESIPEGTQANIQRTLNKCANAQHPCFLPSAKRARAISYSDAGDTVSGSTSIVATSLPDVMDELHNDFYFDFEELFPQLATVIDDDQATASTEGLCDARKSGLTIPEGFILKPGVTIPLLKLAFNIFAQKCGSAGSQHCACSLYLRRLSQQLPHPSTLSAVEECELSREMLPALRQVAGEDATNMSLMYAIRHIYELYYAKRTGRLQSASETVSNTRTLQDTNLCGGCSCCDKS